MTDPFGIDPSLFGTLEAPPQDAPALGQEPMDWPLDAPPMLLPPPPPTLQGPARPGTGAQLLQLLLAGVAAGLGPRRGGLGIATGLNQATALQGRQRALEANLANENALRQFQYEREEYRAAQEALAAEAEHRARVLRENVELFKEQAKTFTKKADYDQYASTFAAGLQRMGFSRVTPNFLRAQQRFLAPDAKRRASEYLDAFWKGPQSDAIKTLSPQEFEKVTVRFDSDGDRVLEDWTLANLSAFADRPFARVNGTLVLPQQAMSPAARTEREAVRQALREQWTVEGKSTDEASAMQFEEAVDEILLNRERKRKQMEAQYRAQGKTTSPGAPPAASGTATTPAKAPRLSASQQEDLATMMTVEDLASGALTLGNRIGWRGVGGLRAGSLAQFGARHFGRGTADEQALRNLIGNITATIAKLRGGTSFTTNEQKLLETYTPTINDGDLQLQSKLRSLLQFIEIKRKNTLKVASGDLSVTREQVVGDDTIINLVIDPTTGELVEEGAVR